MSQTRESPSVAVSYPAGRCGRLPLQAIEIQYCKNSTSAESEQHGPEGSRSSGAAEARRKPEYCALSIHAQYKVYTKSRPAAEDLLFLPLLLPSHA